MLTTLTLAAGTRLGPYEIVTVLGAGGMGEVYRGRDPRIGRDVAIKVLPAGLTEDADRLRRFAQEARATGTISHPNLLTIFDVGTHERTPYLVAELLEGVTLREEMASEKLPLRKTIDFAVQIANGLAAAHAKGIVHRDLKPENIFVTHDGRVKLLDFGLAKFVAPNGEVTGDSQTQVMGTSPGMVMGTTAYMSPEQVRGAAVDQRSDIFSFGVILFEMLCGQHPFVRDTALDTMNAIVRDDLPQVSPDVVPPALTRLIDHAIAKNPSGRFESAKDMAFALSAVTQSGETPVRAKRARKAAPEAKPKDVTYRRIAFRRGFVMSARFAPDGSVFYGAAWEDKPVELFSAHPASPESHSTGVANADILSISPSGELALSLGRRYFAGWVSDGTLARRPLGGGAPRAIAEGVQDAEWTPDGKELVVCRQVEGLYRIESPIGNVLYESARWISHLRVSPRGDLFAMIEHEFWGDDSGGVLVIDRSGQARLRTRISPSTGGLAWSPKGDEIFVAMEDPGHGRGILAFTLAGRERTVLPVAGRATLHDIDKDGNALMAIENGRREAVVGQIGNPCERNLTWFDWSWTADLSADGKQLLIVEQAAAVGGRNTVYVRPTDGSPAVRIGEGHARGRPFSRDAKRIVVEQTPLRFELIPVGVGAARALPSPKLQTVLAWQLSADETRLLLLGHSLQHPLGLYEMALDGDGSVTPISDSPAAWPFIVSNDGKSVAAMGAGDRPFLFVVGGDARPVPGCEVNDVPIGWTPDDKAIYVYRRGRVRVPIDRVDITTGERTPWHTITPSDPAGILDIMPILITPDGQTYAYGYRRFLSDLYVVTGLV